MAFLTLATGLLAASATRNAGIAQQQQYNYQAYTEGLAAKQREIDRRRDLMRALAAQNAAAGVGGIETGGSFGAIVRRNINENQNDLLVSQANLSARQMGLRTAGLNARSSANAGATVSLLDTAGKVYNEIGSAFTGGLG
jgi:hypothetical protein